MFERTIPFNIILKTFKTINAQITHSTPKHKKNTRTHQSAIVKGFYLRQLNELKEQQQPTKKRLYLSEQLVTEIRVKKKNKKTLQLRE